MFQLICLYRLLGLHISVQVLFMLSVVTASLRLADAN